MHLIGSPSAAPQHGRFGAELEGRGVGGIQMRATHTSARASLDPGGPRMGAPLLPSIPRSELPTPDQGLPESVVITMLHQSATGRKSILWGGLDPSGLRLRLLQNRSVTQRAWLWVTEYSLVQGTRTPYRVSVCATCTISSRSSVTASTAFLWTIRPHARRTSTLKYLFVFSSASICLFISVQFYLLLALRYILAFFQAQRSTNLAVIPTKSSPPSHTNLTMAGSAPAAAKDIKSVLENKPLKFKFKTGGASYIAQVHTDRSS